MSGTTARVSVLLAAHNRKAQTLRSLTALYDQRLPVGVSLTVVIVDDGSSDGTGDAVRAHFPLVELLVGSGQLYWNGGMRLAFAHAMASRPDFYLLLNDDTDLAPEAISTLLAGHREAVALGHEASLVVGSTFDHNTRTASYGGLVRPSRSKAPRFLVIPPATTLQPCDTVNGNCLLIHKSVVDRIGMLDPAFTHGMGDLDYGLRATAAGCRCWVVPGFVADCPINSNKNSHSDPSLSAGARWRLMLGPKGVPFHEWRVFTSRHCGPLWPVYWLGAYVSFWLKIGKSRLS